MTIIPAPRPAFRFKDGWQDRVPGALKDYDHWVLWRYELKDGRWTKVPYCAHAPLQHASTTDPQTWNTFAFTVAAYEKGLDTSKRADGIGYVFSAEDPFAGIDFDHCISGGEVLPWAEPYLARLAPTFHDISPSGSGIKLITIGALPGRGTKKIGFGPDGSGAIELYDRGRFFTITGDLFCEEWTTVDDRSEELTALYREIAPPASRSGHEAAAGPPVDGEERLLDLAHKAKNGQKFTDLFEGRYPPEITHSEADFRLCCHLAFWFNRDAAAIDRVFRTSALMRDKWDSPRSDSTYGAYTIDNAIAMTTEVYSPGIGRSRAEPSINGQTEEHARPEPVDVEALRARAAAFRRAEDLYRDAEFLSLLANLEAENPGEAEGIRCALAKTEGFGSRAFDRAMKPFRPAAKHARKTSGSVAGYEERNGYLVRKDAKADFGFTILANFTARIVTQVERHEAGEVRRLFEIQATHMDGRQATAIVPAAKYNTMDWVPEMLGGEFTIFAGRGVKDEVRAAVQLLSDRDGIARSEVHTSLGWIEHDGEPLYIHARGCISREGSSGSVKVETDSALAPYVLPDPPIDLGDVAAAVAAVCRLLDLGKDRCPAARHVAAVLMSLPWRAVLGPFNNTIHFSGPTETRKTSAARLALGFFAMGAGSRSGRVYSTWGATLNALQRLAFDARDSLQLIDELTGEKAVEKATELVMCQGNLKARDRMTHDRRLAPGLDPRCAILSTGEADPNRRSALGRMLMVRFTKKTLDDDKVLGHCQQDSEDGLHALAMAAYIRWLAGSGRLAQARAELRQLARQIDKDLRTDPRTRDVHSRQPEAIAELIAAFELFLRFVVEAGGVPRLTAVAYLETVKGNLVDLMFAQAGTHRENDPARKFIALLVAGLASKRYHLDDASSDKASEPYAAALSWSRVETSRGFEWQVSGGSIRLGSVDVVKRIAYVDPELAKTVAQTMGRDAGQPFESTENIARDLHEAGMTRTSKEEGRQVRLTPNKRIRGANKRYLWIRLDCLVGKVQ